MRWYDFSNSKDSIGISRIKNMQSCFYENNICFDEMFYKKEEFDSNLLTYAREDIEENYSSRLFVNMTDGETYEIVLRKVD